MTAERRDNKPRGKPKLHRPLRWGIFLLLIVLTVVNIYFHFRRTILKRALPYVTTQIKKYSDEEMGADIKWDSAVIDAWGRIVFEGIEFTTRGDTEPLVSADTIILSVDEKNILSRRADPLGLVRMIIIDGMRLRIARDADGKLNLSSLFKPGDEPFEPEKFMFRPRIKLSNCSVEYLDPGLFKSNNGRLDATDIRGGIDLRIFSDIQLALLFDIPGISTRTVTLKGRSNLLKDKLEASLACEAGIDELITLFGVETEGAEIDGKLAIGLHSRGSIVENPLSLLPEGEATISEGSFSYPGFDEDFHEIQGTLYLNIGDMVSDASATVHADGVGFEYGDSAIGTANIRAGWAGEFAYAVELDISGFDLGSVRSLLPDVVYRQYGLRGTADASLKLLGDDNGLSLITRLIPAPQIGVLGMSFNSGVGKLSYHDNRLLFEKVSLSSTTGRSIDLNGFMDFRGESEYRLAGSFNEIPFSTVSTFYKAAKDWPVAGEISGALSYVPYGGKHKLDLRIHADKLETKWGDVGATVGAITVSPGGWTVDGLASEAFGGWISAMSDDEGRMRFALSGIQGDLIADAAGLEGIFGMGELNAQGVALFDPAKTEFEIDLAATDLTWRGLNLHSLSGGIDWGGDGLTLRDFKASGDDGEFIEFNGHIPSNGVGDVNIVADIRDFDIGSLMEDYDEQPFSRTDIHLALSGPSDNLSLEASIKERDINLLGNLVYTCDPEYDRTAVMVPGDDSSPGIGEIKAVGKLRLGAKTDDGNPLQCLTSMEFSDISISGAVSFGPYPTGSPKPMEYRHVLAGVVPGGSKKSANGGLKISGVVGIDGLFNGTIDELVGDISLSSPSLKFGLQEIKDFRMKLKAGGPASYALDGEWRYGSGGKMLLSGPAGWDSEQKTFVVDLGLDVEAAPIDEVLALAGLDIADLAEGMFDGEGRIFGSLGDIELTDFKMDAREGSRLLGMSLQEGHMEFGLAGGILNLADFRILSHERTTGDRCTVGGSGALYLEESSLLPQAQLSANITGYRLEDLQSVFSVDFPLTGKLDADISIEQGDQTTIVYEMHLSDLSYKGKPLPALNAKFSFDPIEGRMYLTKLSIEDGLGGWLEIKGYVTLGIFSALFNEDMRGDLRYQRINLDITGEDFDLGFLASGLPEGATFDGKLESVNLHLEGKPTLPSIDGTLKPVIGPIIFGDFVLADEITTRSTEGLRWEDGILLNDGDLYIKRGDAVANFVGDIDLRPLSPFTMYEKRYKPPDDNRLDIVMATDEPLVLEGAGFNFDVVPHDFRIGITQGGLDIRGRLNILAGTLDAFQIKLGEGGKAQVPVNYNITVALSQGCRLRAGGLLEAVLQSGNVNLSGSPLAPRLSGRALIASGKLNILSHTFNLQPGATVSFTPLFGANPYLKAEAEAVITQHPKAQTGAEPLIINASVESFLLDIQEDEGGIKLTSNYPAYSRNELVAIISYGEIFQTFEEEGISRAFTSGLYQYPAGLISRYVRDLADFHRFEFTLYPDERFQIDLEKELFLDDLFLTYNQTFGEGTNYVLGSKYRFRSRSYAGFRYENLDSQDRQDWFFFLEYLMPIK